MSEFKNLMVKLTEKEKVKKIRMIESSKNDLKKLITSGYWRIIDYMIKVGDAGTYILEISRALSMNPGDVRYKVNQLLNMGIIKIMGEKPALSGGHGGRPRKLLVINYDKYTYEELSFMKQQKRLYEEPVSEKLSKTTLIKEKGNIFKIHE